MYSRKEIDELFNKRLSMSNIVVRDDDIVIVGKYSIIAPLGNNEFDVFICNPKDMTKGLSTIRVNKAVEVLNSQQMAPWTVLDGEAYATLVGTDIIVNNIKLLGLRKRRVFTEEQKAVMRERLAKLRAAM